MTKNDNVIPKLLLVAL